MNRFDTVVTRSPERILATNKVIKNTYMLLSATLLFSAVMALVSMTMNLPPVTYIVSVLVAMVLGMFVLPRTANSSAGIAMIFLITGLLGFGLGSILTLYLALHNGPQIVSLALGGTGVIFLGLSGYALTTRQDFSFLGGFVFVGMMVMVVAIIANIFLHIPALYLAISAGIILLMSAYILFQTSQLIHGGETNYILATYGLYLAIFNIFISLLRILSAFAGDD